MAELRHLQGLDNPVLVTMSYLGGGIRGELVTVQGVGQVQVDGNDQITLPGRLWGQTITASLFNWQGSVVATPGTHPTLKLTLNAPPPPVPWYPMVPQ